MLLGTIGRRLSDDDAGSIDADICAHELAATIWHLKGSSSPGPDGLSYKAAPVTFG